MEAGPEVSFAEMAAPAGTGRRRHPRRSRRRGRRHRGRRQRDQPDAQRRPSQDHAEAARRAHGQRHARSSSACRRQVGRHPRRHRVLPAGAGHPDQHAHQPRAVPVHAGRQRRRTRWPPGRPKLDRQAAQLAGAARGRHRRPRTAACAPWCSVDRETAGRLGVSMQAVNDALNDAFGQRQISTIYAQANQYRVVLEADAAVPERCLRAVASSTCPPPAARRCR